MVVARKYVVKKHFTGIPRREDYEVVEYELPDLQDGEILLKAEWISVDPYMRVYNISFPVPYDQFAFQVATVVSSKDATYPIGTKVVAHAGWCDYVIVDPRPSPDPHHVVYKLPNLKGLSESLAIGAVGMVGATAYFGLLNLCDPKPGETLVVTAAAGAVGSLVGQIGKIKGCKVIGFAGTDAKTKWLEDELHFDKAINYKTADIGKTLKEAAPDGIDCFFDNTGGELSSIVINQMNPRGRVSVCGCISAYNDDFENLPKARIVQLNLVLKEIKMEGFLVTRWLNEWSKAFDEIIEWLIDSKLKVREHVVEGFDNIFDAFVGMLVGDNIGKTIVKV